VSFLSVTVTNKKTHNIIHNEASLLNIINHALHYNISASKMSELVSEKNTEGIKKVSTVKRFFQFNYYEAMAVVGT